MRKFFVFVVICVACAYAPLAKTQTPVKGVLPTLQTTQESVRPKRDAARILMGISGIALLGAGFGDMISTKQLLNVPRISPIGPNRYIVGDVIYTKPTGIPMENGPCKHFANSTSASSTLACFGVAYGGGYFLGRFALIKWRKVKSVAGGTRGGWCPPWNLLSLVWLSVKSLATGNQRGCG